MSGRAMIAAGLLAALASPVAAQVPSAHPSTPRVAEVRFVGQSRASPQLKRDILVAVAGYAKARHSCGVLTTVETVPLAPDYEPQTAMFRATTPQHFYERWNVELCGTKRPFLVALSPSPKGGADYRVAEVPPGTEPSFAAAGPWDGTYVYEQGLGRNPGGIALFVTHTLKVNGSNCTIDAEGVQTDEHIRCKATPSGDRLEVSFVSFRNGGMLNQFDKQDYKPGQPLFSLVRQGNAFKPTWQGYVKNDVDTEGPPVFKRQ